MNFAKRATQLGFALIVAAPLLGCGTEHEPGEQQLQQRFDPRAVAIEAQMEYIARGLERFKEDVGDYPQKLEELFASEAKNWKGPYVGTSVPTTPGSPSHGVEDQLTDPWGNPFKYDPEPAKITSLGPDGQQDTEDDIVVTVSAGK